MEINYTYSYDSSRAKIYKNPVIISTWVIQRKALLVLSWTPVFILETKEDKGITLS